MFRVIVMSEFIRVRYRHDPFLLHTPGEVSFLKTAMSINLLSLRNDLSPHERSDVRDMVQYKLQNATWSYTDDTGRDVNWHMSDHYMVDVVGGDLALTPHERTGIAQFERFIGESRYTGK